jgi:endonuclease YncB( thermonuclease family)
VRTAGRCSPDHRRVGLGRRACGAAVVGLVLGACASGAAPGSAPDEALRGSLPMPQGAREARVVRVVDGDTLVLTRLGSSRLIGVDAPEVRGRTECFAAEATAFVRRLVRPGSRIRFSLGEDPHDRYGRALVTCGYRTGAR